MTEVGVLVFSNADAKPHNTVIRCDKESVPHIMAWYGAYCAGDRYVQRKKHSNGFEWRTCILRINYLPEVEIFQDFETKKWFAKRTLKGTPYTIHYVSVFKDKTYFETLDELLEALYTYAYKKHLEVIKDQLTYNTVKVKL